jgi:hypothetical protein
MGEVKKEHIINWNALSMVVTGKPNVIRSNRKNTKHSNLTQSLMEHIEQWASKNKVQL